MFRYYYCFQLLLYHIYTISHHGYNAPLLLYHFYTIIMILGDYNSC
jgi:hypothetical protein